MGDISNKSVTANTHTAQAIHKLSSPLDVSIVQWYQWYAANIGSLLNYLAGSVPKLPIYYWRFPLDGDKLDLLIHVYLGFY